MAEWEAKEAIQKQARKWMEKANERNVAEVREQMKLQEGTIETTNENPTWQALQVCQIMLPLGCLLQLVPRFTDHLKSALAPQTSALASAFFSNSKEGPTVVDTNSLTITAIIKGREVPGTIIDGGSGVNVISQRPCDT